MYCSNCGTKLNKNDKFCNRCGLAVARNGNKPDDKFSALSKLNLLVGLSPWLNEQLARQPKATPLLALKTTIDDYPTRYDNSGKLLTFMSDDIKSFIFSNEIAEVLNTGLNQDEIEKLPQNDKDNFDKYLPLLNGIRSDVIVIGYLYRLNSEYQNTQTKPSEFNGVQTPKEALERLFSINEEYPDMYTDSGFRFPYGPVMAFDSEGGLISTISKNIENTHRVGKVYVFPDNQIIMMLLLVGWCLSRYDLFRKNKLTQSNY